MTSKSYCETKNDFFKKIMSIRSFTCSSNLTEFLLIGQEFVFFTKSGRKGFRYSDWETVHVRWSCIFQKWGGTILKLPFGDFFTKHLVLVTRKMENRKWKMVFWSESHETSNMIAHFEKFFWKYLQYSKFEFFYCNYVT